MPNKTLKISSPPSSTKSLVDYFDISSDSYADRCIARFFYEKGIAFYAARSFSYTEVWKAVKNTSSNYKAPTEERLSGPLLCGLVCLLTG